MAEFMGINTRSLRLHPVRQTISRAVITSNCKRLRRGHFSLRRALDRGRMVLQDLLGSLWPASLSRDLTVKAPMGKTVKERPLT